MGLSAGRGGVRGGRPRSRGPEAELSELPQADVVLGLGLAVRAPAGGPDLGERVVGVFEFASLVSGGELLTHTRPPWAGLGGAALMPPVPVSPSQRSSS